MSDVLFVSTRGKVQIKDDGSHYSFYVANRIIWVDRDVKIGARAATARNFSRTLTE